MQTTDERYERIRLSEIVPSKTNPRTHFDEGYLAELAGSIREKGVVQPILVRSLNGKATTSEKFEIVAGECRYRASKLGNETHIPAIIRSYTDEQVLELQLVENIHRQDLTPLEQARGYRALIDQNPTKHNVDSIATRIGMSPAWVWDRIKLNDLILEAQKILELGLMSVGHAILIARLKPADQQRAIAVDGGRNGFNNHRDGLWQYDGGRLDLSDAEERTLENTDRYHGVKAVSIRELETWIHDHIRFDVAHMAKAVPLQFEAVAQTVEAAAAQPGRGKKVIAITHEYRVADDARDESERTYGSQSWERADGQEKSKTCEYSALGVVVAGSGQGSTLQVCVARDKCRVHFGKVIAEREKNQKLRDAGKGQKAEKREAASANKERDRWQIEDQKRKAAEAAWAKLMPQACAAVAKLAAGVKLNAQLIENALDEWERKRVAKDFQVKLTDKTATTFLALAAVNTHGADSFARDAKALFGFDLKKFEAERAGDEKPVTKGKRAKKGNAA